MINEEDLKKHVRHVLAAMANSLPEQKIKTALQLAMLVEQMDKEIWKH